MSPTSLLLSLAQVQTSEQIHIDLGDLVNALIYTALGVIVFAFAFWAMAKVVPFSVRKEIEEDQNTALGIIMGSVVIGLALIIAAAIHGGGAGVQVVPTAAPAASAPAE